VRNYFSVDLVRPPPLWLVFFVAFDTAPLLDAASTLLDSGV
jgi:hypothetical protein